MPANLTGSKPNTTYDELLHVVDGPETTEKTVYSGVGIATALKVGTGSASVDNIQFDGNAILTLDTNGDLTLSPNGTGSVNIANIEVTGGSVVGITDLAVADGGTGASTASAARTNLGLGTMATQDSSAVTISGGTITGSYSGLTLVSSASIASTSSLGYATGAGGTVTQATSKSTGVTLNKASGQITTHGAALNAGTAVSFTFTNSTIAATDTIDVKLASGGTAASYAFYVDAIAAGSCVITIRNYTAGNLSETLVLNFNVIKGVNA